MKSKRIELPAIEKGVPLPTIKYHPKTRASRSRWVDFLEKLEPGDSFLIHKGETQTVMIQAKRLDMFITWRVQDDGRVRVWLVPDEQVPQKPKRLWVRGEKRQVPHPKEEAPAVPEPTQAEPEPPPRPPADTPPVAKPAETDFSELL